MASNTRVLEAARLVRDDVVQWVRTSRGRALYEVQVIESAGSIAANIREAFGRRRGRERNQYLRVARSSAEETDEHLLANCRAGLLDQKRYWGSHNRIVVIVRMLNQLMQDGTPANED